MAPDGEPQRRMPLRFGQEVQALPRGALRSFYMLERDDLDPRLFQHYEHYYKQLDEINYAGDRPHLTCEDVLDAHYLICDHFYKRDEGIGGFGPKDFGMLSSAVARQVASAGGSFVHNDMWDIASSLIFGLINDHPFHDANKRTAFLSSVFFMLEHGFVPASDITEVEDFMVEIAEFNTLNGRHMKISEISPKFKTLFRKTDNRMSYIVTFNELQSCLAPHGCRIGNPQGNYIDVYKNDVRVAQVGFPSWKSEVSRNAIATVRKATGLTADNGYDAQVFFKGADPLRVLIGEYEAPLRRLADR